MDTWAGRDLPVLVALARHYDDPEVKHLTADEIFELVQRDADEVERALTHLSTGAYIKGTMVAGVSYPVRIDGVTERGRRAAGQWPSGDRAEALVQLLESRIAATSDAAERSRLVKLLDTIREVGTGVLRGVLTDLLRGTLGA